MLGGTGGRTKINREDYQTAIPKLEKMITELEEQIKKLEERVEALENA